MIAILALPMPDQAFPAPARRTTVNHAGAARPLTLYGGPPSTPNAAPAHPPVGGKAIAANPTPRLKNRPEQKNRVPDFFVRPPRAIRPGYPL